jgi:hypothetical protein
MRLACALLVGLGVMLPACVSQKFVPYSVTSTPSGCQVDVNSVAVGLTPCTIQLAYSERWVGYANAPDGWARGAESYRVECFPPADSEGGLISQVKFITPSQSPKGGAIHFDLRLDAIRPRERIDIRRVE